MTRPRLALAFILATVTLDAIGIGLVFPVMPDLITEVTGDALADAALWGGLLSASFAVMQVLFGPVIGALSDRFGRKPVLLVSLAVMAVDYVVLAVAGSLALLFAARIVAGIAAATVSTATAFIADITPPEERGRRFGLIGACFGLGFVFGPVIGGLLAGLDTRAPFVAAAVLATANLILGLIVLPETLPPERRRPFRLGRANPFGALVAMAARPGLGPTLAAFLLLAVAMGVYPAIWPWFGRARFGWDAGMIGLSLAVYGISFAAGQALLVGPVIRRLGEHRAALFGMTVNLVTLTAMGLVTNPMLGLALIPFTALGGVTTPALQAIFSRAAPDTAQGEVQGVLSSLTAVATIVSPLLMTSVFSAATAPGAAVGAPGAPFLVSAGLMLVCILLHASHPCRIAAASP